MAEKFDEKKYKEEHGYDAKYDAYFKKAQNDVGNDALNKGNVSLSMVDHLILLMKAGQIL